MYLLRWSSTKEGNETDSLVEFSKSNPYTKLTISDDQSAGSKIEERNLLALRGRGNKTLSGYTSPPSSIDESPGHSPPPGSQSQLMPPEQKDKNARVEQDIDTISTGSAAMDVKVMASAPSGVAPTIDRANEVDNHTIKSKLNDVLEGADPSKLDLQKLQEYIELLQAQAKHFESTQSRQAPSRYQIIYRIKTRELCQEHKGEQKWENRYSSFFDRPESIRGQGSATRIQCNLPLTNFDLYLEKNKEITFIVYRNFDPESERIVAKPGTDDVPSDKATLSPQPTSETIRPVNKDLIEAIMALLKSQQEYAALLDEFSTSLELPAPYLFIYHSRRSLEKFQDSLPLHATAQVSVLMNYISDQYADEYAAADSLLSRKKISPEHLHYLFKPGDLLVSRVDGQYLGFVATSWPKISSKKNVKPMRAFGSQISTSSFLYDSQGAKARKATDKGTVYVCKVGVWHWDFDGNFQRQYESFDLEIPAAEDEGNDTDINGKKRVEAQGERPKKSIGEKNISDLNVFPMQFASAEIVDKCRRRGKTFWKCRTRGYVSYQDTERDSIHNLVSPFCHLDPRRAPT